MANEEQKLELVNETKNTAKGVSPKFKKIFLITFSSLALLAIAATVGMHYTSKPDFCASCHQIKPQVTAWSAGPHNQVECLNCHADPGTVGYVKRKIGGLHEVYLQATDQVPDKIVARFNVATCISCHTGNRTQDYPQAKDIRQKTGPLAPKMDHSKILSDNVSCLTCHQNVGHKK
ncbi:cytochrome c3 family protein [Desulfitobacterium sp. Sab5]|uniref:cytochrome c3 family protein n=1 Tax=Desulfitobacterium nosdiversum TaxID=3375356 RepID=UPI003CF2EED1